MPNQDRSIRNITVRRKHEHSLPQEPAAPVRRRAPKRNKRVWLLALVVAVIAALLGTLLSTVFAGATVTVTPRQAEVTLPATIPAQLSGPVGTLPYQTLAVSQSGTTTVAAKGTEKVSKQASGLITISNTYSADPQRIIANTRFQAPDGKIYRIRDSIVIPGSKGAIPGIASAMAYADNPGPDYNRTGDTKYTVPGFKGDPRYTKITATSGPITGGFTGTQPAVAAADKQKAKQQLEQQLEASLRAQLTGNISEGYALVEGTLTVTFGEMLQTPASSDTASLSETATANAVIVRLNDLASAVAKQTVTGYTGEPVGFTDPSAINLSASSTPQGNTLQLQLKGTATLSWLFDSAALKTALIGMKKSELETYTKSLEPAIVNVAATMRPVWSSTFPSDPEKITVKVAK